MTEENPFNPAIQIVPRKFLYGVAERPELVCEALDKMVKDFDIKPFAVAPDPKTGRWYFFWEEKVVVQKNTTN